MLQRLVLIILALSISAMAYANEPGMGDMMQKHIEQRDAAIKELNIDKSKKDALAAVFQKYDKQREGIIAEQKTAHKELKGLLDNKTPDEKAIQAQLDKLESNMDKLHELMKAQAKEIKGILKPSEQAQLMMALRKGMWKNKKGGHGGPMGGGNHPPMQGGPMMGN